MSPKTNGNRQSGLPIVGLVLAALACQTLAGGTPSPVPPSTRTPLPTKTPPSPSAVILSDDFTFNRWGTGTDADSAVEYRNGTLRFRIFTEGWFVWSTPDGETYRNVHIEVTALTNDTAPTTALGIMCNKQAAEASYYYFAITPAGEYAIGRAIQNEPDFFLTNDDQWAASELITQNAAAYRLGADCGNGALTLYVDGQQIASVSDTTYASGGVGLFVWSGAEATNTDVAFDDFLMTEWP